MPFTPEGVNVAVRTGEAGWLISLVYIDRAQHRFTPGYLGYRT